MSKVCRKCGELKPLTGFDKNCGRNNGDGHLETCTPCRKERTRKMTILNFKHLGVHLTLKTRQGITEKMSIPLDVVKALIKDNISINDLKEKLGIENELDSDQSDDLDLNTAIEQAELAFTLTNDTYVKVSQVSMTNTLALALLDNNKTNRQMSVPFVKTWVDTMMQNNWQYNGDTICIAKNGQIIDGQHRLQAIVDKYKLGDTNPISCILVTNLNDDTYPSKDCGIPRGAKDVFYINNVTNDRAVAAVTNILKALDSKVLSSFATNKAKDSSELYKYYKCNDKWIKASKPSRRYITYPTVCAGTNAYMLKYSDSSKHSLINTFFKELSAGELDTSNNSTYNQQGIKVRNYILNAKSNNVKINSVTTSGILIRACTNYISNRDPKILLNRNATFPYIH